MFGTLYGHVVVIPPHTPTDMDKSGICMKIYLRGIGRSHLQWRRSGLGPPRLREQVEIGPLFLLCVPGVQLVIRSESCDSSRRIKMQAIGRAGPPSSFGMLVPCPVFQMLTWGPHAMCSPTTASDAIRCSLKPLLCA